MASSSAPVSRQGSVKKASEYRQHAKECRALAAQAVSDEHRKQLAAMADTWETLALEREKVAAKDDVPLGPPPAETKPGPHRRTTH
jgi:hypothetical protein